MNYNWSSITSKSYLTLVEMKIDQFPITKNKIKCKDVIIASYQKYSEKTGMSIQDITLGYELNDAFFLQGLRPGINLILYNKEKSAPRLKHTLLHELGHIKCQHKKHGEQEEIEAHFFAAQVNAPNVVIKEIAKRGYHIDVKFLIDSFGLSKESAQKKIDYISQYGFEHTNEYDDIMLIQFKEYINLKYPPKTNRYFDDDYDDRERERQKW